MISKEKIFRDAQRMANRGNSTVCVLNLNRIGAPVYVIRGGDHRDDDCCVGVFEPQEQFCGEYKTQGD